MGGWHFVQTNCQHKPGLQPGPLITLLSNPSELRAVIQAAQALSQLMSPAGAALVDSSICPLLSICSPLADPAEQSSLQNHSHPLRLVRCLPRLLLCTAPGVPFPLPSGESLLFPWKHPECAPVHLESCSVLLLHSPLKGYCFGI